MKRSFIMTWLAVATAALIGAALAAQSQPTGQPSAATRPARHHESPVSDFPDVATTFPAATAPATQGAEPAANAQRLPPARDEDVGRAIDAGITFLLSQFRDGDLSTARELSESQRQSLFALCAYALAQTGQSVDDPRISVRGKLLPAMLDRLKTFVMVSDVEKMNRPVTYGRALRAAALATYDRPTDRAVLKEDVAWLVQAQVNGAYTYDDFYTELVKKGMKGQSRLDDSKTPNPINPSYALSSLANLALGGLLTTDNPYPPPGNFAQPPRPGGPRQPPGDFTQPPGNYSTTPPGGIRVTPDNGKYNNGNRNYNVPLAPNYNSIPPDNRLPRPAIMTPVWPRPTIPWARSVVPRSYTPPPNYIGPHATSKAPPSAPPAGGGMLSGPALGVGTSPPQLDFQFPWDNSNSQYGVFGVWAGAEVGIEVPDAYWQAVQNHWLSCQLADGQWFYNKDNRQGTLAMTAGGVASLLATHEYLDLPMLKGQVGREPYSRNLAAGLAWMEKDRNSVDTPTKFTHYMGYDLFSLSRVGLNTGYKFFGTHDWYRELSTVVVRAQFPNGAWGHEDHGVDAVIDTAYSLLFLARGRPPVLMTKLKFEKYWDNRPRDVSNLARFAGKQLERKINWQVVGIEHTWDEWFDSPVLYVASHAPPRLHERDFAELSKFAWAGGLIFTQADAGSRNFDQWVTTQLIPHVAPGSRLVPIPDSDPIYSVLYKIPNRRQLMGVTNGARWLLVHSQADMGLSWQMRSDKTRLADFQLGLNIFLYAAGKVDLHNRLESPYVAPPDQSPTRTLRVARLSFEGNWDPEPGAWPRFSRVLHWETATALDLKELSIEKLTPDTAPLATITGTGTQTFSKAQCDALANYVKAGGILLVDPCAGNNDFRLSVRDKLLPVAFTGAKSVPVPKELAVPMRLRPFSAERHGGSPPRIEVLSLGKGYVLSSPVDLTSGLLGTNTYAIDGFQPASAQDFLARVVAWAAK